MLSILLYGAIEQPQGGSEYKLSHLLRMKDCLNVNLLTYSESAISKICIHTAVFIYKLLLCVNCVHI